VGTACTLTSPAKRTAGEPRHRWPTLGATRSSSGGSYDEEVTRRDLWRRRIDSLEDWPAVAFHQLTRPMGTRNAANRLPPWGSSSVAWPTRADETPVVDQLVRVFELAPAEAGPSTVIPCTPVLYPPPLPGQPIGFTFWSFFTWTGRWTTDNARFRHSIRVACLQLRGPAAWPSAVPLP